MTSRNDRYRSALLAERARLTGLASREMLQAPRGVAVEDQGPLLHEQFVHLRRHGLERRRLRLIDAALERLDRGEFGVCLHCEEDIPERRLHAVPWAEFCVPCQDRRDALSGPAEQERPAYHET
jgi:DnaK suppressor protein